MGARAQRSGVGFKHDYSVRQSMELIGKTGKRFLRRQYEQSF
jgi:hypothetical protein